MKSDLNVAPIDVIIACFIGSIFLVSATAHSLFFNRWHEIQFAVNHVLRIIQTIETLNRKKGAGPQEDFGPKFLRILVLSAVTCNAIGFPSSFIAVHFEFPWFRYFKFYSAWIYIPIAGLIGAGFILDWAVVLSMTFIPLLYFSTTLATIADACRLWWLPDLADWKKDSSHKFYRCLQVQHATICFILRGYLPYILLTAIWLIIIPIFFAIRLTLGTSPIIGIATCVGFFAMAALHVGAKLAGSVYLSSIRYSRDQTISQFASRTKIDKARIRSYQPLKVKAGNCFTFKPLTFPIIIQEVVVTAVINLLVISSTWFVPGRKDILKNKIFNQ